MPSSQPICTSGSHEVRRPKPIPIKVREACLAMIYGRSDDDSAVPLDFIQAAKARRHPPEYSAQMAAQTCRRGADPPRKRRLSVKQYALQMNMRCAKCAIPVQTV